MVSTGRTRLLLVSPRFPENFWSMTASMKVLGRAYSVAPNGLPTIAALTPRDWDVEIVDENVQAIDFDASVEIVGITAYSVQMYRLREIAREFKRRGKLVVIGGPGCTDVRDLPYSSADGDDPFFHVRFQGEAERTWPKFCADYERGTWQAEYIEAEKVDVASSPIPRFELLKLDQYGEVAIQTTRGCPFHCEFCDVIKLFGRVPRYKTAAQIVAEVERVLALGADRVFFADDNFIGNRKHALEVLHALVLLQNRTGRRLRFGTQLTINVAESPDVLDLMHEAGFVYVFVGIESPSGSSLAGAGKKINIRKNLVGDVRKILARGIQVKAGMILGFDEDRESVFDNHLAFLRVSGIPIVMEGVLIAQRGTPLYERLAREGRILLTSEGEEQLLQEKANARGSVNFRPFALSSRQLVEGYRRILSELYDPDHFAERMKRTLRRMQKPPNLGALSGREIMGGIRTFANCLWRRRYRGLALQCIMLAFNYWRRKHSAREFINYTYQITYMLLLFVHMREFCDTILSSPLSEDIQPVLSGPRPTVAIASSNLGAAAQLVRLRRAATGPS